MKNKFKENLKLYRESNNISQSVLADRLSVSLKTISHWETGYSEPTIEQIVNLAILFEISIDDLLL